MAKLEIKKESQEKNTVELRNELGCSMSKLYYNDQFVCYVGSVGEKDKENAVKCFTKAIESSNGNVYEAQQKLMTMANWDEAEVTPDKSITVEGRELAICYKDGKIVDTNGQMVVELNEALMKVKDTLTDEVIEAILVPIATTKLQEEAKLMAECDDYDDDCCCDDCYGDCRTCPYSEE